MIDIQGKTVRVKKGSLVKSFNPSQPEKTLLRAQSVKVHHVIGNEVTWSGSGSYWYWTDIGNIEVCRTCGSTENPCNCSKSR